MIKQSLPNVTLRYLATTFSEGQLFRGDGSVAPPPGAFMPNRPRLMTVGEGSREFSFACEGCVTAVDLKRADLLFLGRGSWHQSEMMQPHTLLSVIFDDEYTLIGWREKQSAPGYTCLQRHLLGPADTTMSYLLRVLERLPAKELEAAGIDIVKAIFALLDIKLAAQSQCPARPLATRRLAESHIREHFADPLSLTSVAAVVGVHPGHLSRLFHQSNGDGFQAFVERVRMENAAMLLETYRLSVKEVAERSGYQSANYFGKAFRRYHGISPAAYRSRQACKDASRSCDARDP